MNTDTTNRSYDEFLDAYLSKASDAVSDHKFVQDSYLGIRDVISEFDKQAKRYEEANTKQRVLKFPLKGEPAIAEISDMSEINLNDGVMLENSKPMRQILKGGQLESQMRINGSIANEPLWDVFAKHIQDKNPDPKKEMTLERSGDHEVRGKVVMKRPKGESVVEILGTGSDTQYSDLQAIRLPLSVSKVKEGGEISFEAYFNRGEIRPYIDNKDSFKIVGESSPRPELEIKGENAVENDTGLIAAPKESFEQEQKFATPQIQNQETSTLKKELTTKEKLEFVFDEFSDFQKYVANSGLLVFQNSLESNEVRMSNGERPNVMKFLKEDGLFPDELDNESRLHWDYTKNLIAAAGKSPATKQYVNDVENCNEIKNLLSSVTLESDLSSLTEDINTAYEQVSSPMFSTQELSSDEEQFKIEGLIKEYCFTDSGEIEYSGVSIIRSDAQGKTINLDTSDGVSFGIAHGDPSSAKHLFVSDISNALPFASISGMTESPRANEMAMVVTTKDNLADVTMELQDNNPNSKIYILDTMDPKNNQATKQEWVKVATNVLDGTLENAEMLPTATEHRNWAEVQKEMVSHALEYKNNLPEHFNEKVFMDSYKNNLIQDMKQQREGYASRFEETLKVQNTNNLENQGADIEQERKVVVRNSM